MTSLIELDIHILVARPCLLLINRGFGQTTLRQQHSGSITSGPKKINNIWGWFGTLYFIEFGGGLSHPLYLCCNCGSRIILSVIIMTGLPLSLSETGSYKSTIFSNDQLAILERPRKQCIIQHARLMSIMSDRDDGLHGVFIWTYFHVDWKPNRGF